MEYYKKHHDGLEYDVEAELKIYKVKWDASWQNQQIYLCAQRRLGSAWAFAQSDQSLSCPHEETLDP